MRNTRQLGYRWLCQWRAGDAAVDVQVGADGTLIAFGGRGGRWAWHSPNAPGVPFP